MQTSEWNLTKEKAAIANYNFNYPLRSTTNGAPACSQSPVADASKRSDGFLCATANVNGQEWKKWKAKVSGNRTQWQYAKPVMSAEMENGKWKSGRSEISGKRTHATTK